MTGTARVTLQIPAALRMHSDGEGEWTVRATTVRAAFCALRERFPALVQHLLTREGELRPFVKIFVRNQDVRDLGGLDTPLKDGDAVAIVASVAGG